MTKVNISTIRALKKAYGAKIERLASNLSSENNKVRSKEKREKAIYVVETINKLIEENTDLNIRLAPSGYNGGVYVDEKLCMKDTEPDTVEVGYRDILNKNMIALDEWELKAIEDSITGEIPEFEIEV
jgi:hypothetical protein